jgi:hypothetical protein
MNVQIQWAAQDIISLAAKVTIWMNDFMFWGTECFHVLPETMAIGDFGPFRHDQRSRFS